MFYHFKSYKIDDVFSTIKVVDVFSGRFTVGVNVCTEKVTYYKSLLLYPLIVELPVVYHNNQLSYFHRYFIRCKIIGNDFTVLTREAPPSNQIASQSVRIRDQLKCCRVSTNVYQFPNIRSPQSTLTNRI